MFRGWTEVVIPTTVVVVRKNTGNTRVSLLPDFITLKVKIQISDESNYTHVIYVKNMMNQVTQLIVKNQILLFHTGMPETVNFPWRDWLSQYLQT